MLIGVTPQYRSTGELMRTQIWGLLEPYINALENQGASTVVLPPQPDERLLDILHKLDGLVLPGGADIDPEHFGEEPLPGMGEISLERDQVELFAASYAAKQGLPTLGICRGVQVMNVALGGSLYQDLPSQGFNTVQHSQKSGPPVLAHSVQQVAESPLYTIFKERFRVNSYHHQSIKDIAPGLKAIAVAPDGVIEALHLESHPFYLGVQWHPELLEDQWGVFGLLVKAARAKK
jgi:putative glutamine amidotransferase